MTEKLLLETVEDAFLSALEEGAKPPREFTVRVPWDAFDDLRDDGTKLCVAGHVVRIIAGSPTDPDSWGALQ